MAVVGWDIGYMSGANLIPILNRSYAKSMLILNDLGQFEIIIADPDDTQMAALVDDCEIRIDSWSNSLYGFVKFHQYSSVNNTLTIRGSSYAVLAHNTHLHVDNAAQEDATLSSGFRVVYNSKAFNVIGADVLTNTGLTAGTINNFGTVSIRFENKTVLDCIKDLAKYAKYDWKDNTDKSIDIKSRVGSATVVAQFDSAYNAHITNWERDSQTGNVYKIVVLGKGNGSAQIQGTATHADYDRTDQAKNKTRIFTDPSIASTSQANTVAQNLLDFLNTSAIVNAAFSTTDIMANVQIGDAITLRDPKKGSATLRISRITRTLAGSADELIIEAIDNDSKMRKAQFEDFLKRNNSLTEALGSVSQGSIKTITVKVEGNCNSTTPEQLKFQLPAEIASTADILTATFAMTRKAVVYDVDGNTGLVAQTTSDSGHSGHAIGTYDDTGHTHLVAAQTSGVSISESVGSAIHAANSFSSANTTSSSWYTVASLAGADWNTDEAIEAFVNILDLIDSSTGSSTAYVRILSGSDYFPSSSGYPVYLRSLTTKNDADPIPRTGAMFLRFPIQHSTSSGPLYLQVQVPNANTKYFSGYLHTIKSHKHSIAAKTSNASYANLGGASGNGTANIVNPQHQNPLTRSVYAPGSEVSLTLKADLNGANVLSASGNVGYQSAEVDITAGVKSGGIGWQYVNMYPSTSIAFLSGEVKITYIGQEIGT
ncbi:MAG: hypothetical protein WC350_05490 [Candidatus Micrarchaeia archaeon]|jgi:hypothetical protein